MVTNLHMPLFPHGVDNTPLYGSPAGTADWHAHLVMTRQTEELPLQFSCVDRQLLPRNRNVQTVELYKPGERLKFG